MSKIKIGQEVFLKPIGNNARGNREIEKGKIVSIKNKYFYILKENWQKEIAFEIENNVEKSDFADWKAYTSIQEIEDEKEQLLLHNEIKKWFEYQPKLSLDELRKIIDIIKDNKLLKEMNK